MIKYFFVVFFIFYSSNLYSQPNTDQWEDTEKTYKDLIDEGFEVKAYDTNIIEMKNGYILMFFITVLQNDKEVYECQEYQTLDENMETINLSLVCRKVVQPYEFGIDT